MKPHYHHAYEKSSAISFMVSPFLLPRMRMLAVSSSHLHALNPFTLKRLTAKSPSINCQPIYRKHSRVHRLTSDEGGCLQPREVHEVGNAESTRAVALSVAAGEGSAAPTSSTSAVAPSAAANLQGMAVPPPREAPASWPPAWLQGRQHRRREQHRCRGPEHGSRGRQCRCREKHRLWGPERGSRVR